jgi:hypothetical protein
MTIHDIAPLVAPIATAIAVLIPVLRGIGSTGRRLDAIERTLLQLILHDEHLPIRERLIAGKCYLDIGGNGATAVYYEKLAAAYGELVEKKVKEERK